MADAKTTTPARGRGAWRTPWPEVGVLGLGLLLSLATWWVVRGWETRQQALVVRDQVEVIAQALNETLRDLVGEVQVLAQFYDAAAPVGGDAFSRFTRPSLERHPALRALEWVPLVREDERAAFEARVRAEGLAGFAIAERIGGTARPAAVRPEYYPVLRVEPLTGNAAALGLDQGADPLRRAALEQARDTGQPAASAPLTLARESSGRASLIIFVPQGPAGDPGETPQVRRARVQGFAVGVLRLADLLEGVTTQLPPLTIDLVLLDPQTPDATGVLESHPAQARPPTAPGLDPARVARDPLGQEAQVRVAGRTLVLRGAPAPGTTPRPLLSLALLGLVLASSGLAWLLRYLRAAQSRLRDSEQRLRLALDAGRLGIYEWNLADHRIVWTREHERLWGFAPGEFDGTYAAFASRLHPDDAPLLAAELTRCMAQREPHAFEFRVVWPDGSVHWAAGRGEFVCDAAQQPTRMYGTVMDVTERHRTEQALNRYRQIVETSSEMLIFLDPDLRYQVVNPAFAAFYGTTPEALQGRRVQDVVGPAVWSRIGAPLRASLAGETQRLTVEGTDPQGRRWWLTAAHQPFRERGRVQGIVVSFHNLTEVRETQAALETERATLEERVAARTAELRASEAKLRTIYDLVPVGISITDPQGRMVDCNRASETLLGIAREEHLKRTYDGPEWPLIRPDGTPMSPDEYASVRAMREGRAVTEVEMGLVRPAGVTWLSVSAMPAAHPEYGVVIAFVDITERKRAALALQTLTDRLQLATEAGGIAVWEWDMADNRLTWDARMYQLYGLPPRVGALSYADWTAAIDPEDLPTIKAVLAAIMTGHAAAFRNTFRVVRPDGSRRYLVSAGKVIRDAGGVPQRLIGVNWDVTDEQRTQLALEASEARARAVIDTSPVPMLLAHETGAVSYINAAFTATLGYTLADMPTLADWRLKAEPNPAYRQWVMETRRERLAKAQRDGGPCEPLELALCCKDGTIRTVVARATPLEGDECLNTLYDITDLKRAREEAEQAARSKAEFLAHMSHEIRTPMNGIIGLSELALRQPLAPQARDYLEKLNESGRSLLGILNDILDHSRLEAGRLNLSIAPMELDRLLATLRALFAHAAAVRGLGFAIETGADVPRFLLADALRLQQVLSNLLGNALKFTHQGQVRLRVECLGYEGSWARLRWTVQDTGIGMDAATRACVFEPFVQGDPSIARRYGGSGLGLAISRNLVRLMGGHLGVASTPGVGSTFTLDLRLHVAATAPPETGTAPRPDPDPHLAGARVLVAEDQAINRQVIGDMLRLLGVRVTLACDGQKALALLSEARFDAVLMDVQMPEMDGLTATARIRANPAWATLPVIALTAGVTEEERQRVTACGMTDLLPKPVTLEALDTTLGRLIRGPKASADETVAALAVIPEPAAAIAEPGAEPGAELGAELGAEPGGQAPPDPLLIPGFDLRTLAQIAGDPTQVIALLYRFAAAIGDEPQAIGAALARGDTTQATQRVHRLKGTAGNLGAVDLSAAAQRLETALHDTADPAPALELLTQAHGRALARIAELPPPAADQSATGAGDPALAPALAAEIHSLLIKGLRVPAHLSAGLQAALPAAEQALYLSLKGHLDRFDYPAAARLLAPLLPTSPQGSDHER